jgi:L-2-hydroxyglutarate oxidase LhgO
LAKDLAREMVSQGLQFGADVVLDEEVQELEPGDGHFVLKCRGSKAPLPPDTSTVLLA